MRDANHPIYYSQQGDYQDGKYLFEISGKNKKRKQVASATLPVYLIQDDTLAASQNAIPLLFLGFIA